MGIKSCTQEPVGGNSSFCEIHYTVTTPDTADYMGGHGVHITLVTFNQEASVRIYFRVLDNQLEFKYYTPRNRSDLYIEATKLRDWHQYRARALQAFRDEYPLMKPKPAPQPLNLDLANFPPLTKTVLPASTGQGRYQTPLEVYSSPVLEIDSTVPSIVETILMASGAFD